MPPQPELTSPSLLSPANYDCDAASLRSPSEQDSDSEDDEFLSNNRSTMELAEHDRAVLEDEDETEKLLTRQGPVHGLRRMFSASRLRVKIGKRERQRRRAQARKARRERVSEEGELMYEMEEGLGEDDSLMSEVSEFDAKDEYSYEPPPLLSWPKLLLIFLAILVLFLILALGAYKASSGFRDSNSHPSPLLSNGTAFFAPTTILISLDGFRADFLDRGLTPALNALIADGASPQYMHPSFPSVTFPNHYTFMTGLYPECHGIVGNSFWDPDLQEEFYYTHPAVSMQPKWWNAEPLWVTAEDQGVKTAIHMWPGSEAHIGGEDPSFLDKYNGTEALSRKVDRILGFLDLPGPEHEPEGLSQRPQFIAAYVPNVDRDGHNYGPNSTEIRKTIAEADQMIEELVANLDARNLTDVVNIVVVSDHGMATTSTERLVQLDDLIDLSLVERIDGWPSRGLRPKNLDDLQTLQDQLELAVENYSHAIEVYTREAMPERYHFSNNNRIAPLWVIPKAGWAIVERPEFDANEALKSGQVYQPKGIHGYDHEHPLMRAIFIARGPAFPHTPNSRLEVFQNTEVYNILCDSLKVDPLPNNGTLRLPLKPVGLHSDENAPAVDRPSDPPRPSPTGPVASTPPDTKKPTKTSAPEASETPAAGSDNEDQKGWTWWGTLKKTFGKVQGWASGLWSAVSGNGRSA